LVVNSGYFRLLRLEPPINANERHAEYASKKVRRRLWMSGRKASQIPKQVLRFLDLDCAQSRPEYLRFSELKRLYRFAIDDFAAWHGSIPPGR
jgi:hypothetical protein